MSEFSKRFKELREARGMTQDKIAEILGISRSTVAGYESEDKSRVPREETLTKIADLFGTSIDYLLGRTIDKTRTLRPHSRKMIDLLDQDVPADEVFEAFSERFMVGGIPMNKDEALWFIDFLRARRARQKKENHPSDSVSKP